MADTKLSLLGDIGALADGDYVYAVRSGVSYRTSVAALKTAIANIRGSVATYSLLPITVGTPVVGSLYVVETSTGTWPFNRQERGMWRRIANAGALADWTRMGDFTEVLRDDYFTLKDDGDATKQAKFQLSGISTGTTRLITLQDKDGTLAVQEDVDLKAPIASPTLTGVPAAPTAAGGTNSTQLATTAFVKAAIDALINGAPGALDTLKEISDQLATDESVVSALVTTVSGKVPATRTVAGHALSADVTLVKADVGLGSVDNTADAAKPVSSAQQAALDAKANLTDVQVFTASGTWTRPTGAKSVRVIVIGAGGGGGAGRKGAASTNRSGGGGGAPGGFSAETFAAASLSSTESVVVGVGGAGGSAQTTNSTDGAAGADGGPSSFGNYLKSFAGTGGLGGPNGASASGGTSGHGDYEGTGAAPGIAGAGVIGGATVRRAGGPGAGGGGVSSGNAEGAGAVGGDSGFYDLVTALAGGTAGAVSGAGGNGTAAPTNGSHGGAGGGSGGGSKTTNGGAGGNGGKYGGGGGGGGGATDSVGNSGAGGAGADGIVIVISSF